MRIYFFSEHKFSGRGGMEQVILTLFKGLEERGHELLLILPQESNDTSWESEVSIELLEPKKTPIPFPIGITGQQIMSLSSMLEKIGSPDIIISLSPKSTYIAKKAVLKIESNTKVVSWIHFSLDFLGGKRFLKYADAHLAISSGINQQINKMTSESPCKLVYNPVKLADYPLSRSVRTNFLFVGRLHNKQKRVDILLKALSKVNGEWALHIIGDGHDSKLLKAYAKRLEIEDKITWHGWKKHPWNSVDECTALIMSSIYEGFGLVLVEALSRGIPVVSSNCPTGPDDIVINNENGWLFQTRDVSQLTFILQGIVDKTLKIPTIEKCIDSAEKFDQKIIVGKYEKALFEFLDK